MILGVGSIGNISLTRISEVFLKELQYHRNINSLMRNRHRHIIKRHFTTRKVWNLMKSYLNFRLKKRHVSSFPTYLKIETTDRCQLRCPGCHDGSVPRKNLFLDFDLYTHLIDQLGPYLLEVSLFDQGEPLLDRRITEFVEYASSRNIGTVISTNLSLPLSDETMIRLIDGGLDYLQVAIDALDQDSYQEYRVGGKLDLVFRNLERLVSLKKERGSSTPFIEWQMIEFPFNANQRQAAEKKAMAMGVESFVLKPDGRCNQVQGKNMRGVGSVPCSGSVLRWNAMATSAPV